MGNKSRDEQDAPSVYLQRDSIITNVILAALFSNFLFHYYFEFTVHHKFSAFLMMIQVTCLVVFFLIRVLPKKVSFDKKDWAFALLGTWLPLLILPSEGGLDIPILVGLQLIGVVISTIGILSLNRSFAIVPALREVKTSGLYRVIRHPIYFGYAISFSCLVLQNFSVFNVLILGIIIACDVMRILAEERVLSEDAQYVSYKARVRWRLIPYIW